MHSVLALDWKGLLGRDGLMYGNFNLMTNICTEIADYVYPCPPIFFFF